MQDIENKEELDEFINNWTGPQTRTKKVFDRLMDYLLKQPDNILSFHPRPGVTYSLRAKHNNQRKREIYTMVDIIDDDPSERWLSVCFYGDLISDPEERGDFVPDGLLGEDATCFDVEAYDDNLLKYIEQRFDEAHENAAKE
jgi:hypothetical protein